MEQIKLYQWRAIPGLESASPFCIKVHWALRYKQLSFEVITPDDRDSVVALNPRAKLPVLGYGDTTVADSSDIIRFIEARHPEPHLLPSDPALRARALIFEDWGDESIYWHLVYERWQVPEQFEQYANVLFPGVPEQMKNQFREGIIQYLHGQGFGRMTLEQHREKMCELLDALDAILVTPFLCGNELSIGDIGVAAEVAGLNQTLTPIAGAEVRKRKQVMRWLDRVLKAVA
ncbi:MAG: glutathione S-transferase family protein [Candidatus Binataceae bacterium]|nr:glutathione S-transferase family protein [Candidatus Binataceae bacterium]